MNGFLMRHNPKNGPFLFEKFGFVEAAFTPLFQRFWFLEYYDNFTIPDTVEYARINAFRSACLEENVAKHFSFDDIAKIYYDYSRGVSNGSLVSGRTMASVTDVIPLASRPLPNPDKYSGVNATDAELGLVL
jgi:glutathione S-transferase